MTREEAMIATLQGNKVRHEQSSLNNWLSYNNGHFTWSDNRNHVSDTSLFRETGWELYVEPPKPVKWTDELYMDKDCTIKTHMDLANYLNHDDFMVNNQTGYTKKIRITFEEILDND